MLRFCSVFYGITLLVSLHSRAQIEFHHGDPVELYYITEDTHQKIIDAFLKDHKANEIEFNPNKESSFPLRIKNKKGNWILFSDGSYYIDGPFLAKESKKYSFDFPASFQERMRMTLARRKDKKYWVSLEPKKIETKIAFDELRFTTKIDTQFVQGWSEEIEIIGINDKLVKIAVRIDDKWGCIEPAEEGEESLFYVSRNFLYESSEEVPSATGFSSYQLKMMEQIRKDYNVDLLINLDEHGFYFMGRDEKTKQYGLYMGEGQVSKSIPAEYSDIKRHLNEDTFEVWKDDKVGYYNSDFKLVKEANYDDFHFMHLDYKMGCALKKNGYWQLFDNYDGSLLVEGKAKTIEELQELWLNR